MQDTNTFYTHFHSFFLLGFTWIIDKFDQFDYQNQDLSEDTLVLESACFIVRDKEKIMTMQSAKSSKDLDVLAKIEVDDKRGFMLKYPVDRKESQRDINLVIISMKEHESEKSVDYSILDGDVIKFGRLSFRVAHINKP